MPLTLLLWVAAFATHDAARIGGPLWVAAGAVLYVLVRRSRQERLLEHVKPAVADLVPEPEGVYENILVPLKLGLIGEEVLATALRLAEERRSHVRVLHVIRVPLDLALDADLPDEERRAQESLDEIHELATEHGVELDAKIVRSRALGAAIVDEADSQGADLIVLGSAPRWRRQSRFFSPTVDYVLRKASCEVMVVTYPQGVLDESTVERMKALIVGCGRVGSALARTLNEAGWAVSVVDETEEALGRLGEAWPGEFHLGHGMDTAVLEQAGIEDADTVIVATDGDNTNIVVAQVAKNRYGVESVGVRILDPARADFYSDRGLHVVSPTRDAIQSLAAWATRDGRG